MHVPEGIPSTDKSTFPVPLHPLQYFLVAPALFLCPLQEGQIMALNYSDK